MNRVPFAGIAHNLSFFRNRFRKPSAYPSLSSANDRSFTAAGVKLAGRFKSLESFEFVTGLALDAQTDKVTTCAP